MLINKKFVVITLLLLGVIVVGFSSNNALFPAKVKVNSRELKIHKEVIQQMISFHAYVKDTLLTAVTNEQPDEQEIRRAFLKSRLLFKKFEWASAYFTADLTKRLNGPPVQEIENADLLDPTLSRAIDPTGLQVIEELIYPNYTPSDNDALISEVRH